MNASVAGVQLGVAQAGIKKVDRDDLVLSPLPRAPAPRRCLHGMRFARHRYKSQRRTWRRSRHSRGI